MKFDHYDCSNAFPVAPSLELIGGNWKGMALYHLLEGKSRFNELTRNVENVTQRILTKQHRELEADGLISRQVYAEVPPEVEYRLTEKGKYLRQNLLELEKWGTRYALPQPAEKVRGA